ncbi:MAG: hypothetical protein JF584_04280 [Acidobacteria bacterium]|nr:hypothetical protein [Acidobacteriota bacterium]
MWYSLVSFMRFDNIVNDSRFAGCYPGVVLGQPIQGAMRDAADGVRSVETLLQDRTVHQDMRPSEILRGIDRIEIVQRDDGRMVARSPGRHRIREMDHVRP